MTAEIASIPDWATPIGEEAGRLRLMAAVPLPSGSFGTPIDLTIRLEDGLAYVSETVVGSTLPARCPELHIVEGGDFCLGFYRDRLDSSAGADRFWTQLADFLRNQRYAARHRRWPAGRWLSHGQTAADEQLASETISAENGWAEDYSDAIENGRGWLAGELPRPRRQGVGLVNGRAPCPKGCRRRDGAPILRRDCDRRSALETLILCERRRRSASEAYAAALRASGTICCGRMDGCPLHRPGNQS